LLIKIMLIFLLGNFRMNLRFIGGLNLGLLSVEPQDVGVF
jgi:hypothetical protein